MARQEKRERRGGDRERERERSAEPELIEKLTHVLHPHELPRRITAMRHFQRTASGKVQRERTLQGIL